MDWALNTPDIDFLSTYHVPSFQQSDQADDNKAASDDFPPMSAMTVERSNSVRRAFRRSIGRWTPDSQHYRGLGEQGMSCEGNLAVKVDLLGQWDPSVSNERLSSRTRDKLIAVVLASCEPGNISAIVSAFPEVEVLEGLVNLSLASQRDLVDGYIHVPTFSKSQCRTELLAALMIEGAAKSPSEAVRKFGFGLGEILGNHLHKEAERNHTLTRDLEYLQAFCLNLDVALWSGIKNKMELAESTVGVLVNMMRAAGRYRRTAYHPISPSSGDFGDALDHRWRAWVRQESFKRMACHIHIHCARAAFMTSEAGSHLSPSELAFSIPESRELWIAQSAAQWKETFLRLLSDNRVQAPSLLECVADPSKTGRLPGNCDYEFAQLIQVYGISTLVREFKRMQSIFSIEESSLMRETVIADESQEKRLVHILNIIRVGHESSNSSQAPVWHVLRELTSMHLHTFFDQIELLAGREGPEEARMAYPVLRSWIQSQSSRQAVWHAGQVLRHMRAILPSNLHIFHAVACYHAGLCLWIYGNFAELSISPSAYKNAGDPGLSSIFLDGEESLGTQRWIASNIGIPMISHHSYLSERRKLEEKSIPLSSAHASMEALVELVEQKFQPRSNVFPLLVENICHLMRTIGKFGQPDKSGVDDIYYL
ncbi:hypothetical protein BJX66DRAFT_345393 [Aspergillus keveii]|uniref:Transcription factor domain-containing protein n=1 Tax=Aspergillus keveii TaxID=714993 RepID=A0ABR4FI79_9EURO